MTSEQEGPLPTSNQRQWNVKNAPEESRVSDYLEWRMNLGVGNVQDIDQLEYGEENGLFYPKAVVELSKVHGRILSEEAYLPTVVRNRSRQMQVSKMVAERLGVPAVYLLFEDNMERMWKRVLTSNTPQWRRIALEGWKRALEYLHE